jgi:hypothetical protein
MFEAVGYISNVTEQGVATIVVPLEKAYRIDQQEIREVRVIFSDGRTITPEQRKAIYATLRDIADWSGYGYSEIEEMKAFFKLELVKMTGCDWFSLSDCDVSTAREMLTLIINFCLKWDVPASESLLKRSEEVGKYLYACLIYKKCCICGVPEAELHHVDAIGSARRATTQHIGREALSLCREHHDEAHTLGKDAFNARYNVFGIRIDKTIAMIYGLHNRLFRAV